MAAAAILLITLLLGGVAERLPAKQGNAGNAFIQFHSSITKALSNASVAMRAQAGCASRGHCVVPAGETWMMDSSVDVETLTIKGTLTWDTSKDGLELRAGYVLVDGGHLQIGTRAAPMALRATVYIKDSSHRHEDFGTRFLGGLGSGRVDIHGRPLTKTWTQLSHTAQAGATTLRLKDDPVAMGWRVGDRIGVATTTPHTKRGRSTIHTIASLGASSVTIREPLQQEHWGGRREVAGRFFEMTAEVVNMERSVLITGDHHNIEATGQGLHTIMTGDGYMDMRYTRVEHCGQRPHMGRYCLHFHVMKHCERCVFQGNAVMDSQHVGITVHGTHRSTVDQNIVWDARAVGLYVEDGNEMDNTFSRNVVICTWWQKCSVDWVGGVASQGGGAFWIGMSNNMIGNHIVGYELAWWTPGAFRGSGQGRAIGRVCAQYYPFGEIRDNVFHDNARFGLYLDNQFPRNVERDADGFLTNRASCNTFTADGRDNGVVNEVHNHFDWHNTYIGMYAAGDLQFVNWTGVNNGHAFYWKQSKNFADGRLWHFKDSVFAQDPNDFGTLQILGPAGPFTFGISNSVFLGSTRGGAGALQAGQHCGKGGAGGPCNVQYLLDKVEFSLTPGSNKIQLGVPTQVEDQAYVLPMFIAKDDSLGGYRSIVSGHLNGFRHTEKNCQPLGQEWGGGIGCDALVRRLNVWGPDAGRIKLKGPGYQVAPNWAGPSSGRNAGEMYYDSQHGGYGTPVLVGESYVLEGRFGGSAIVEFSDPIAATYFGAEEALTLQVGAQACELQASDDRSFLTALGHLYGIGWKVQPTARHSVIEGGSLRCGNQQAAPVVLDDAPPSGPVRVPACDDLPDVKKKCSADGCKVLADGMTARPCTDYCEGMGLMCIGAWEEVNDDCNVKETLSCGLVLDNTSDLICECASSSGPTPSPGPGPANFPTPTVQPDSSGWAHYPSKNCFAGNGAQGIVGYDPAPHSLSIADCKAACEADESCDGIVMPSSQAVGQCWLRKNVDLSACPTWNGFDLWMYAGEAASEPESTTTKPSTPATTKRPTSTPTPAPRPAPMPAPRPAPSPLPTPGPVPGQMPTPSAPLDGSSWVHHRSKNCWAGHGAQGIVGYDPAQQPMSIADCKAACEAEASCEAIVMPSNQEVGLCFLRKDVDFSACRDYNGYDVWMQGEGPASPATTTAPTAQAPTPSTQSAGSPWVHHPNKNCYAGYGAQGIAGFDPAQQPLSIASCKSACEADASCEAIVMPTGQQVGQCWLRKDVDFSACLDWNGYDVWMHRS